MSWRDLAPGTRIVVAWLLLSTVVLATALPHIDRLGLYYDEAFMAQQARDFVEPDRAGTHPGSVRSIALFGRPFPLRNAVYLGSLKSQLLIPSLAVFGSSPRVVRTTTLVTALLALLLAMVTVGRLLDPMTAIVMGLLVATDPAFYFLGQFEWGPFTTNLLCRSAAAWLLVVAWQSPRPRLAVLAGAMGGACLGLGFFSRADFAVIPLSAAAAIVLVRPDLVGRLWREKRMVVWAGAAGLAVTASPMLLSTMDLLTSSGAVADRGDWSTRLAVLASSLDGSHFHRLMQTGGRFDEALEVTAPATALPWMLLLASAALVAQLARGRRSGESSDDVLRTVCVTAALLTMAMLAMPGAVRAHHQLNSLPLLHLILAAAAVRFLHVAVARPQRVVLRTLVVGLVLATVGSQIRVIQMTAQLIDETGGKGRWSHALTDLAREIDVGETRVVSLDWGFHEPLLLLTDHAELHEAIWAIPKWLGRGQPWVVAGDENTYYLVHDEPYDLFGLGPLLLDRMREEVPGSVNIREHRDGQGGVAFYSVRVLRPHKLAYTGQFRLD